MPSHVIVLQDLGCSRHVTSSSHLTPGPDRPSRLRPPRRGQTSAWPAPKLIGVAVDGSPSGRDATVLGSLVARAMGAELMLIAVHEEPLLPVDLPGAMNWTAIEGAGADGLGRDA